MVASPPAQAAGPDTAKYINATYQLFLGRNASGSDVEYWDSIIDRGDRSTLTSVLASSDEWAGVRVNELYQTILRRSADVRGRSYWVGRIQAGYRLEDIASFFYGGEEYFARADRSLTKFVDNLYRDLLGRPSDRTGRSYWVRQLRAGLTRSDAAANFYASIESREDRVTGLYREILRRNPDTSGLRYWSRQLLSLGDVSLASYLASSGEFYRRATGVTAPPPGVIRLRGSDDRSFRVDLLGPTIVRSRHSGGGNFIIEMQDANGGFDGLGANAIGNYSGELYVESWSSVRFVDVTAGGTWSAELLPLAYASPMNLASGAGSSDSFKRVASGAARLTQFTHNGSGNFIVVAYDVRGEYNGLVVNEIGSTSVSKVVPAGTEFLEITAGGGWTTR